MRNKAWEMNDRYVEDLKQAVEKLHSCGATLEGHVPVKEMHGDQVAWDGVVSVFHLDGHPHATICYAWSSPVEGSDRRKFYAVLNIPPVTSPQEAVRAAIVQDFRSSQS